jgi:ankyrin repeat protein
MAFDDRGRTTLHHSAVGGYNDCIKAILNELLKQKGKISSQRFLKRQDDRGWTALHYAVAGNFSTITILLLAAGASPKIEDRNGVTPYGIAARERFQAVMEVMAKFSVF